MIRTHVVNLHHYTGKKDVITIDRHTLFGNQFHINDDMSREEVIQAYRSYFYHRLILDWYFKRELMKLKGQILGCWCKPLPCHGDVIAEYLNKKV